MTQIRYRSDNSIFLIVGLLFFGLLIALIIFVPPKSLVSKICFLSFVLATIFCLVSYIGRMYLRSILLGLSVMAYALLRIVGFKHWLIGIALFSLGLTIEIFLRKRRRYH